MSALLWTIAGLAVAGIFFLVCAKFASNSQNPDTASGSFIPAIIGFMFLGADALIVFARVLWKAFT